MDEQAKIIIQVGAWCALFLAVAIGAAVWSGWYQAGLQTKYYNDNGIAITQWQVFMGVKVPDRVLHIKKEGEK